MHDQDTSDLGEFIAEMEAALPEEVLDSDASLVLIVQEACRRTIMALGPLHNARHFVAQVDDTFQHTNPPDTRVSALHQGVVLAEQQLTTALKAYGVDLPSCPLDDPAYAPTFDNAWPTPPEPEPRPSHLSVVRDQGEGEGEGDE